jgi:hypothetical protein
VAERAVAARATVQLQHHRRDVAALRDRVAVPAVRGGKVVGLTQRRAHASGDGLLVGVQVDRAGDPAVRQLGVHPLLERADRAHHPVRVE